MNLSRAWLPVSGVLILIGIVPGMPNTLFLIASGVTFFIWWIWLLPRYSVAIAGFYEELKKEFKG